MSLGSGHGSSPDTHEFDHDFDSEQSLGVTVVLAVAEVVERTPEDLPESLDDVVDSDALDSLFARQADGTPRQGGRVQFTFSGCLVDVASDGRVLVTAPNV